jgi:hypothetical protein
MDWPGRRTWSSNDATCCHARWHEVSNWWSATVMVLRSWRHRGAVATFAGGGSGSDVAGR